ncbi:DUF86 domain-containing protein [Cyanobacterium aponinum UTEX 3222]|uniref:HepT-like ribonuclease domain-containing protein n=1 Tax=Cyanobacterium aponinum TaxID=379064 RepID=UPI0030928910|nr:DUF86 domain-containing protein [Cyanobacterium aponinum UTEX 3222]
MNRDLASLVDALIFAKRITDFTQNMEKEDFANDLKTQAAVMYEISVLGEAMRRISTEFYEKNPQIPYKQIIGMRNKLVHDYDGINTALVWSVSQVQIPELINILELILSNPQ